MFSTRVSRPLLNVRAFSSSSSKISTTFLTMGKNKGVRQNWLSDPSTYPLLAAMAGAAFLVVGVGSSAVLKNPDVRLSTHKKHATIRDWSMN